ncbi:MAG: hypothetical protein JNL57_07950 [Bacteroidetes bacterium]|nr:hypothetical protein [Bacteroidota bacterium]
MNRFIFSLLFILSSRYAAAGDPVRVPAGKPMAWDNDLYGFVKGKVYLSGGYGFLNPSGAVINGLKNSITPNWKDVSVHQRSVWYAKGEYAVGKHQGLGFHVAGSGLDIDASLDSLTKYNVKVQGKLKYRSWSALLRYNFHVLSEQNLDLYAGIGAGYRSNSFSVSSNDPDKNWWDFPVKVLGVNRIIPKSLSLPTVGLDFTMGVRYHILPPIALYAEAGLAKSMLQAGATIRF